ncbi:hypothetical protein ACJMK2_022864, partial [Sinanodonta woodiana]
MCYYLGSSGDLRYTISKEAATWDQAYRQCLLENGTLAIINSEALRNKFNADIQTRSQEPLWVGRFVGYTQFIWIHGCYGNNSLPARQTFVLTDNSLVSCQYVCTGSLYIGMQGENCYCFDDIPRKTPLVPGINCQNACPGEVQLAQQSGNININYLSQCGKTDILNSVSVYKRVSPLEVDFITRSPDVGECIYYSIAVAKWYAGLCVERQLFTCDTNFCNQSPDECKLVSNQKHTWFEARQKCEGNGGYLSIVNKTTNSYFKNKNPSSSDVFFWTGLHRKEVEMWSHDATQQNIVKSDRCVFTYKDQQTGRWEYNIEFCTTAYRYVCIMDFKTTTMNPLPFVTSTAIPLPTVDQSAVAINITGGAEGVFG